VVSDVVQARQTFAAQLRDVRRRTNKTLRELEKSTFASDSAWSRYLSGRSVPPWRVVEALCIEAGVDPAELHPVWTRAKHPSSGSPPQETGRILADDLAVIATQLEQAIRQARERGEHVPATVLAMRRISSESVAQLRPRRIQPARRSRRAVTLGGTKKYPPPKGST